MRLHGCVPSCRYPRFQCRVQGAECAIGTKGRLRAMPDGKSRFRRIESRSVKCKRRMTQVSNIERRPMIVILIIILISAMAMTPIAHASDRAERELERSFATTVRPFLESYCFGCHGAEKQKGKL